MRVYDKSVRVRDVVIRQSIPSYSHVFIANAGSSNERSHQERRRVELGAQFELHLGQIGEVLHHHDVLDAVAEDLIELRLGELRNALQRLGERPANLRVALASAAHDVVDVRLRIRQQRRRPP